MTVTLYLATVLTKLTGGGTLTATGATVGKVIGDVAARYPTLARRRRDASGTQYAFVMFYLNDENTRFQGGFDAPVQGGDDLTIVPAIAGG